MLFLLILIGVFLILFNLFIWLYDEQKIKLTVNKSLKLFKYLSLIVLGLYFLIAIYVYLFYQIHLNKNWGTLIPNRNIHFETKIASHIKYTHSAGGFIHWTIL